MANDRTLLEKVAREICRNAGHVSDRNWRSYVNAAQAAIDTIRAEIAEPNAAMQLVVSKNWGRRTWDEYRQVIAASPLGGQKDG